MLSSELKNTERVIISQSINNGQLTAIFAPYANFWPRPDLAWGTVSNPDQLMAFLQAEKSEGRHVFSLASIDDSGFGFLTMEGFGIDQIFSNNYSFVVDFLKTTDRQFCISAVASWGSSWGSAFCFVLTEGVHMYEGGGQGVTIENSWSETEEAIEIGWEDGLVITELCFSKRTGQYLLVMTKSTAHQMYGWDLNSICSDKFDEGYHPTIILDHPTHNQILTVMTKDDNRSSFTSRERHPIEF